MLAADTRAMARAARESVMRGLVNMIANRYNLSPRVGDQDVKDGV